MLTGHAVLRSRPSGLSTFGSPRGAGIDGSVVGGGTTTGGAEVVVVVGEDRGHQSRGRGCRGGAAAVVVAGASVLVEDAAEVLHPVTANATNRNPTRRFAVIPASPSLSLATKVTSSVVCLNGWPHLILQHPASHLHFVRALCLDHGWLAPLPPISPCADEGQGGQEARDRTQAHTGDGG